MIEARRPVCSGETEDRPGVTLLELIAVVLLIGLLAATTMMGFRRSIDCSREQLAIDTLLRCDRQCRTLADRTNHRVCLRLDTTRGVVEQRSSPDTDWVVIGRNVKNLKVLRNADADESQTVEFLRNGRSEDYLIEALEQGERILLLGSTGQPVRLSSDREPREFFDGR